MTNQVGLEPLKDPTPARLECGAQKRRKPGEFCRQPAGKNTPHEGSGKCWLHGGLTPVKSGRWSTVTRRAIKELVNAMQQDPEPLDILQDLFMVRALLIDFLNRYEENRKALLAWHLSWNGRPWRTKDLDLLTDVLNAYEGLLRQNGDWEEESADTLQCRSAQAMVGNLEASTLGKPREILDISDAHRMAVEASKMVERIEKIRARGAVSREDFARVMTELGRAAETALSPSRLRQALFASGVDVEAMEENQLVDAADTLRNGLSETWMSIRVV